MTSAGKVLSENSSKFQSAINLINEMWEYRFIEKICRPESTEKRISHFKIFSFKLLRLHEFLTAIQAEYNLRPQKKKKEKRQLIQVKQIRQLTKEVQMKYKEFFIDGSFKNYVKVAVFKGLPIKLHLINIQSWSHSIVSALSSSSNCRLC